MMRLRLQMLTPASERCSWKRRISSSVAVSGDRFRNAANRLQLRIWPLCVPAQSLREFMSSIHALAQRLTKARITMEEFPQSIPNLTAATSNLFDLIQAKQLALYPDAAMRLAISRAIVTEFSRGWKLDKAKQSHKIDIVVALSMAALAAIRSLEEPDYDAELLALAFATDYVDKRPQACHRLTGNYWTPI